MKKILFLLFVFLVSNKAIASIHFKESSVYSVVHGKAKDVKIKIYKDKYKSKNLIEYQILHIGQSKGNKELLMYMSDGRLKGKVIVRNNQDGHEIAYEEYNGINTLILKIEREYNSDGLIAKKIMCEGKVCSKYFYYYNKKRKLVRKEVLYGGTPARSYYKIYEYSKNIIKTSEFSMRGELRKYDIRQFESNGNIIIDEWYDAHGYRRAISKSYYKDKIIKEKCFRYFGTYASEEKFLYNIKVRKRGDITEKLKYENNVLVEKIVYQRNHKDAIQLVVYGKDGHIKRSFDWKYDQRGNVIFEKYFESGNTIIKTYEYSYID